MSRVDKMLLKFYQILMPTVPWQMGPGQRNLYRGWLRSGDRGIVVRFLV